MISFFIKKWFFDLWDNLLPALIMNILFLLPVGAFLILPSIVAPVGLFLAFTVSLICQMGTFLLIGVYNRFTLDFVIGGAFQVSKLKNYFRTSWLPSIVLGAILYGLAIFLQIGIPFYTNFNQIIGLIVTIFMFWLTFFSLMAVQFYWPLNAQIEPSTKKLFKKSFILVFDNPAFSLIMLLGSIVIIAFSLLTLSIFPGITGLILWFQVGLKLRMYKYDYLETVDSTQPRHKIQIPWDSLLAMEREKVGPRSLKGMFFPWKE